MPPSPEELAVFAARRARVRAQLGAGVLVVAAAPERFRTADIHYPYRQDSDLDYLTGFPEPESVAVIAPGSKEPFVLFVRPRDPEREQWVGWRAGVEGAVAQYGADAAHSIDDLERVLASIVEQVEDVWLTVLRDDALATRLLAIVRRAQEARPRTGHGPTALREPGELLHEMRLHKEPAEIACMRDAITIACEAHREAMRAARPGMREYEIEALIDYTFRRRGATGPAYPSIVASGPNATVLHYTENTRALGTDELLLVDAGAERAGYCADVTRTFPTGARFTTAHRELYEVVLGAQLAAIDAVRPETTLEAVHTTALRALVEGFLRLGLIPAGAAGSVDEAIEKALHRRLYMHRTSHWLGRDVHDVGSYARDGRPRPLAPGMVLTVEPGCYVPADADDVPAAFRGVGIRIEDDVLVTADGSEVLSAGAPKRVADVEALRGGAGH
jgi:Xaa-Pro aminopeptidase